jgi:hypothetical protein
MFLGLGVVGVLFSGCDLLGAEFRIWTLTGQATYSTNVTVTDSKIKLGAFYFEGGDARLTISRLLVSNVIALTGGTTTPFTALTIDTTSLSPSHADRIILYMWIEPNAGENNAFDATERKSIVAPNASDPVFDANTYAAFTYYQDQPGLENGWYVDSPSGLRDIESAILTGALIINEFEFK